MSRYKFYQNGNEVICVSSYGGKKVRAVAKCSPEDTFDFDAGKRLAQARVDAKIADKRAARATAKYTEALNKFIEARDYVMEMQEYMLDSVEAVGAYNVALGMLEREL